MIDNRNNPQEELRQLFKGQVSSMIPTQTYWATVKEVNWEEKTMEAVGVANELSFYDVLLGLGSFYRKPKIGSPVLIGVIENQQPITFMIDCEEFDEAVFTSDKSTWTINKDGFIIKQSDENLYKVLADYMEQFGYLADEINKIQVAIGTSPNIAAVTSIKNTVTQDIKQRLNIILK